MTGVGKNIKTLRTQKGISQDELAEKLFVSRQTVSNYETGKTQPDIQMLIKISEALGTETSYIIYGVPSDVERRKQYKKLAVKIIILIIFIILFLFLNKYAVYMRNRYYDPSITIFLSSMYSPLLFVFLAFVFMQACSIFLGAKPIKVTNQKKIYYILIALLAIYFLAVLPYNVSNLRISYEMQEALKNQVSYSSSGFSLNRFLDSLVYLTLLHKPFKYIFLIFGVLLWNFKPDKIRKEKKEEKQDE